VPTVSEQLFEKLCSFRGVEYVRIPEGQSKTADYEVSLGCTKLIIEVKQLDPSAADKQLEKKWGHKDSPVVIAPSDRVQRILADAYPQVRALSNGAKPTMVVIYNNSGEWNWIDSFTISKAMFGLFGFRIGPNDKGTIVVAGQGYMGKRKVTKESFRALSVVAAMKNSGLDEPHLDAYHNPFATVPIRPDILSLLATAQFVHPNPHKRGVVGWEPKAIKT